MINSVNEQAARKKRVKIEKRGGDDKYSWCLIIDGRIHYNGMSRSEASFRRERFIETGGL